MIFVVINILVCAALVYASFHCDRSQKGSQTSGSLVNLLLLFAVIFFFMAMTILLCSKNYHSFALLAGRITYLLTGWFSVLLCCYLLLFPDYRRGRAMGFFQLAFFALAVYIIFFAPGGFESVSLSENGALQIGSEVMLKKGPLSSVFPVSWLAFYNILYRGIVPAFVSVMVLVRAENAGSKLRQQNMVQNVLGVAVSWALFWYLEKSAEVMPVVNNFMQAGFIPAIYFFIHANTNDEISDGKMIFMSIVRFVIGFIVPVAICAGLYMLILPLHGINMLLFEVAMYLAVVLVLAAGILFRSKFKNSELFRKKKYSENFEKDITSIDFNLDSSEITGSVFKIFKKYAESSSMTILIDDGTGSMVTVYSSESGSSFNIPVDQPMVDVLMNNHLQVIFREFAQKSNSVVQIKDRILEIMDKSNSDVMIMLNEGRQFIGLILLGKKISGNIYSEYDYEVFNKFYSNLFVVGYYVKNIMNEAVVGTVNREIRMSGQIITSIQENMDLIKSKKVDAGYLMTPARSIGGEFVDMIRLTDTRHIFVIGALSGKGIAASMGMVILKSIIRTFLTETTDFKTLVAKVNVFIRESLPRGTFFAGTFGLLDFATDTMYYINCGIPALFVYTRAYNNVIEIQGEGHILGFVKDVAPFLKVKKTKLSEGDIVMIVTDGILDTKSLRGDIFGKTRTQTALMENSMYPAEKMARFTYDALAEFTSKEMENDVTILVMKYLGNQAQPAVN